MKLYFDLARRLLNLVWYHAFVFFRTIRCLPPIFVWLLVIYFDYETNLPLPLVQRYTAIIVGLFFISVWFGYLFLSSLNQSAEYICILKIGDLTLYFVSKVIFLFAVSMGFSLIGALYPICKEIMCWAQGFEAFEGGMKLSFIFGAFVLYTVVSFLGMVLTLLFAPNLSKRRDVFSMVMIIIFALASITKDQIFESQSIFKYASYIFPPVIEIGKLFYNKNIFVMHNLIWAMFYGFIYSTAAIFLRCWLDCKKLYAR